MGNVYQKLSELLSEWQNGYCAASDDGGRVEKAIVGLSELLLGINDASIDCCDAVAKDVASDNEGDAQVLISVDLLVQLRDLAASAEMAVTAGDKFQFAQKRCSDIEQLIIAIFPEAFGT